MNEPHIKKTIPTRPQEPPPAADAAGGGKQPKSVWLFLRTLFVGSAGLAFLSVVVVLAGSVWLTANQRAEAEKRKPWADPSFTTTAVTTGGLLARWMDNDGDLANGHSYIKGIYDLWKSRNPDALVYLQSEQQHLPQLWAIEANNDIRLSKENEEFKREKTIQATAKTYTDSSIKAAQDFADARLKELNIKP